MSDTEAGAKPGAKKASTDVTKTADEWQEELGIGDPLHAATRAVGGWKRREAITKARYGVALKKFREGAA